MEGTTLTTFSHLTGSETIAVVFVVVVAVAIVASRPGVFVGYFEEAGRS
jgi:hypothetical protein